MGKHAANKQQATTFAVSLLMWVSASIEGMKCQCTSNAFRKISRMENESFETLCKNEMYLSF